MADTKLILAKYVVGVERDFRDRITRPTLSRILHVCKFSKLDPMTPKVAILGRFTEWKIIFSNSLWTKYYRVLDFYQTSYGRHSSRTGGLPHPLIGKLRDQNLCHYSCIFVWNLSLFLLSFFEDGKSEPKMISFTF